jgi:hypothetical protein
MTETMRGEEKEREREGEIEPRDLDNDRDNELKKISEQKRQKGMRYKQTDKARQ